MKQTNSIVRKLFLYRSKHIRSEENYFQSNANIFKSKEVIFKAKQSAPEQSEANLVILKKHISKAKGT